MRFLTCLVFLFTAMLTNAQTFHLFIGTYTGTGSKGIYVYRFDAATGKATWVSNTDSADNPSYLALHPNGSTLYACNEVASPNGGRVTAYAIDKISGALRLLNSAATAGDHPCYVAVHPSGGWLTAGNYSGGSVTAFRLSDGGDVQPCVQMVQHSGRSVNQSRQEKPHVHATVFSPDGKALFAPDLGLDQVKAYKFSADKSNPLKPASESFVPTAQGAGPRHLDFHPNGKTAYLIEELTGTVVAYRCRKNKLMQIQRIAVHADTARGEFGSADIHASPDGKFLYASNRGQENNLAIFKIDDKTGALSTVGYQSTLGVQPRNFCIDPTGNFLLAANQGTDNIVIFKRDISTGLLTATGEEIKIPRPVCLKMQ